MRLSFFAFFPVLVLSFFVCSIKTHAQKGNREDKNTKKISLSYDTLALGADRDFYVDRVYDLRLDTSGIGMGLMGDFAERPLQFQALPGTTRVRAEMLNGAAWLELVESKEKN